MTLIPFAVRLTDGSQGRIEVAVADPKVIRSADMDAAKAQAEQTFGAEQVRYVWTLTARS